MTTRPFPLRSLDIGDDPQAWADAGFDLDGEQVRVGGTVIRLLGSNGDRGIVAAMVEGIDHAVDGMPFAADLASTMEPVTTNHRNGVAAIDHLVATSPNLDRTTAALAATGITHRRTRRFDAGASSMRQEFFWLGNVILELVGEDTGHGNGQAQIWGLAFTCDDLDAAADELGDAIGPVKPAVQPGRRIASVRTRDLDISIPVALLSPHRPSADSAPSS